MNTPIVYHIFYKIEVTYFENFRISHFSLECNKFMTQYYKHNKKRITQYKIYKFLYFPEPK